ncbi:MAG: hypothetical protein JO201_04745 [Verrucomicrobia bacterium]|nr:hypothetical protein [Verrucomicrobiota bacterium]
MFSSTSFCVADEYLTSRSPDGKFVLHVSRGDKQPFPQSDTVIERTTRKVILDLDQDARFAPEANLVWSGDSQLFAYVRETNEDPQSVGTRVFQRNGATFDEIKLPDLPAPKLPSQASSLEPQRVYITALRWPDANSLELDYEMITDSGWRGAEKLSLKFDQQSPPTIVKTEAESVSIVDYFLLLPDDTLETRPRHWMHNATVVDKKNGYMSVSGDGAQPSFEVALFRHRDGRPLLAVCQADLESDDPRCVSVEFFDLGADGKMQKVDRKIFPVRDQWDSGEQNKKYEDFRFIFPRQGRTILVRNAKTKKILHKVTWNGEKFIEQRDAAPR